MPKWLTTVRKVLGLLTDWLTAGRKAGLWSEKPGANPKGTPHQPGPGVGRP